MWLSKKFSACQAVEREGTMADMGVTTIGGGSASVMTRGEQRDLEIFSPGGVVWQPRAGDTVLVIKGGVGCQESCVAAADTGANAPKDMAPGELYLYSDGGASVYLRSDGSIEIKGPVKVEGDVALTGDVTLNGDVTMTGDLSSTGNVAMNGRVEVFGSLFINGAACPACLGG